MAGWLHLSTASQNTACDALVDSIDAGTAAGYFEIYANDGDGTPANANTAVTTQTLLVTITFGDPAAGASSSGTATANSISSVNATDTGTAAWARFYDSDDNVLWDADVGATGSGAYIELETTSIVSGNPVTVSSMTFTMPSGV